MNELSWKFLLVNHGIETIKIKREGETIFEGTVPAGYSRHLTIGDSVYYKLHRWRWVKKFGICIWREQPALRFGKSFGAKDHYLLLSTLPHVPRGTYGGQTRSRILNPLGLDKQGV